jgi:hypothetical protein
MNGYLSYLVGREHTSDLLAQASRRELWHDAKRARTERPRLAPAAQRPELATVYCVRAAAPVGRAAA